jgi:hypothetical protein
MGTLCDSPSDLDLGIDTVWKEMTDVAGSTSTIWLSECGELVAKLVARQRDAPWIDHADVYEREVCALERLEELGIHGVPRIVAKSDEQKAFVMTHCGSPLNADNAPPDVRAQLTNIVSSVSKHHILHNDIESLDLQQVLVKNGLVYICDWGWASLEGRFDWGVGLRHEGIREHILGERLSDSEGVERMLRHLE